MNATLFRIFFNPFLIVVLTVGFYGCDLVNNSSDDKEDDRLYVQFNNDSSSTYIITGIELQDMGVAGETPEPSGTWSENVLDDGVEVAPQGVSYFYAEIPNLHWCKYRLTVKDNDGSIIKLYLQEGYIEQESSITHWGSDERTVNVVVVKNAITGLIEVTSWGDFAGID
ncbi:MAG: hypothetical protein D8M58_08800 [Calditrichaeota bacterium]|nr:MAG: hypothetical protein DWQ03_17690 [Calditrichota bacterium]MBL1205482.1 hypothetical protein [Calditrichota bacterium]NOG45310.1 hypothetical protein [Calditrichota bacterium]